MESMKGVRGYGSVGAESSTAISVVVKVACHLSWPCRAAGGSAGEYSNIGRGKAENFIDSVCWNLAREVGRCKGLGRRRRAAAYTVHITSSYCHTPGGRCGH
jgi:hypothetical protein